MNSRSSNSNDDYATEEKSPKKVKPNRVDSNDDEQVEKTPDKKEKKEKLIPLLVCPQKTPMQVKTTFPKAVISASKSQKAVSYYENNEFFDESQLQSDFLTQRNLIDPYMTPQQKRRFSISNNGSSKSSRSNAYNYRGEFNNIVSEYDRYNNNSYYNNYSNQFSPPVSDSALATNRSSASSRMSSRKSQANVQLPYHNVVFSTDTIMNSLSSRSNHKQNKKPQMKQTRSLVEPFDKVREKFLSSPQVDGDDFIDEFVDLDDINSPNETNGTKLLKPIEVDPKQSAIFANNMVTKDDEDPEVGFTAAIELSHVNKILKKENSEYQRSQSFSQQNLNSTEIENNSQIIDKFFSFIDSHKSELNNMIHTNSQSIPLNLLPSELISSFSGNELKIERIIEWYNNEIRSLKIDSKQLKIMKNVISSCFTNIQFDFDNNKLFCEQARNAINSLKDQLRILTLKQQQMHVSSIDNNSK